VGTALSSSPLSTTLAKIMLRKMNKMYNVYLIIFPDSDAAKPAGHDYTDGDESASSDYNAGNNNIYFVC
jgi:hypothetical protein